MSFLGIDLSASSKKPSFYALIDGDARLSHLDYFSTFDELHRFLDIHAPSLVAIDAPLSYPLGLDCLEEDHQCEQTLEQKGRTCEQELARMGIGCFFTTKRSIIKGLIYRGIELSRELANKGFEVIEVYPYATKVIIFGDKIPPKNTVQGMDYLKARLSPLVNGMEPYIDGLNHDGCDAILAAYTACLHSTQRTNSLGIAEEGYIVVPKPQTDSTS